MTLQDTLDSKLTEYQTFLDAKGPFNTTKNEEFMRSISKLERDIKNQENRALVGDLSYRGAPGLIANEQAQKRSTAGLLCPEKEVRAFDLFLRRGLPAVQANEELRTYAPLDSTDLTLGQYLVPVTTGPEIEKKLKSVGQILTILRYINSSTGEPINWPTSDDTAEKGEFIAENGAVSQSNPVFGNVPVSAFQWSSKQVLVPIRLMQDSKFDVVAHLTECFGLRAGRGFSDRVMNDTTDGLLTAGVVTGTMTSASATVLNYFEPLTLQGKVDLGYAQNGTYVMSFATYLGYRALVSTTGQALWQEADYKNGILHGRPFILCNDMPSFGTTTNKYLMFGDFSKVLFRTAGPMTVFRFNELFMNNLQQGFQSYQRVASKVIQPSALAILKAA
jgi:HK97 family phage major capsid protein